MRSSPVLMALPAILLAPLVIASAASQFHLNPATRLSNCFISCYNEVTSDINLPDLGSNSPQFVTRNCAFDQWQSLMSECFTQTCISAPDAAYAVEYGRVFCQRAGVETTLQLPETYVQAASASFDSAAYTSGGTRVHRAFGMGGAVLVVAWLAVSMA